MSPSNSTSSPTRGGSARSVTSRVDQVHRDAPRDGHAHAADAPPRPCWTGCAGCRRHIRAPWWRSCWAFWRGTWLRSQRFRPCQFGGPAAPGRSARPRSASDWARPYLAFRRLRIGAVQRHAGPHQVEMIILAQHGAGRRPGWRAPAAAWPAPGGSATAAAAFIVFAGSSPQARWLITSTRLSPASRLRMLRRQDGQFVAAAGPAGSCRYRHAAPHPARARRRRPPPTRPRSRQAVQHRGQAMRDQRRHRIGDRRHPAQRCAPWAASLRKRTPSSSRATKKVSQPASASAGATRPRPGHRHRP